MTDIQCFTIQKIKSELGHILVDLTIIFATFVDQNNTKTD